MTPSAPEALLLDHPALPVPLVGENGVELQLGPGAKTTRLARKQRIRIAVQLIAATSLLAEFDLWPGRKALAHARITEDDNGLQAVLFGVPRRLSTLWRRLGGGEAAADATRETVLDAVAASSGLPRELFLGSKPAPGLFLSAELERLLKELPKPLDPVTARNLWMARWQVPTLPEVGEAAYWSVLHDDLACRFACAVWTHCRRAGDGAWLWWVGDRHRDTGPLPAVDATGVLVVCGHPGQDELAVVARWIDRPGCRAVVVGSYPQGWNPPPPPGFDASRLPTHLAVTGESPERCRQQVEGRSGRFDPLSSVDRSTITEAARQLWKSPRRCERGRPMLALERTLRLLPEGLPEGFVLVHSANRPATLRQQARDLSVVIEGDRWRLPIPERLRQDSLHGEVALLFEPRDPKRLRHLALADGDASDLVDWARQRLASLDGASVREVLGAIEPNQLGTDVDLAYIEACLSELDLEGARAGLSAVDAAVRRPWQRWLEVTDAPRGHAVQVPSADEVFTAPRPAAEIALYLLRRCVKTGFGDLSLARDLLNRSCERLSGAVRRRFELEHAALCQHRLLRDRWWRIDLVAGSSPLRRRLMHLRGLQLAGEGRHRAAHRLLRLAARDERSPGRLGFLELDMGYWALTRGRSEEAGLHLLRAVRLLQAAGFRNRTRLALFNLAVSDIDHLRVGRARRRLRELREQDTAVDPFVVGEEVRLALAIGDEAGFRHRLARFPFERVAEDLRFRESIALLRGIEALIIGDLDEARDLLTGADEEGRQWLGLAAALAGERMPPAEPDGWGVNRAAGLLRLAKQGRHAEARSSIETEGSPELQDAFALALIERLVGSQQWIDRRLRSRAVAVLENAGLVGWARLLRGTGRQRERLIEVLARLVDVGGVDELSKDDMMGLLWSFHLDGLEVRSRPERQLLCRWGAGVAGQPATGSRVDVVPLGGDPPDDPAWRLLLGLIDMLAPDRPVNQDGEGVETGIHGSSPAIRSLRQQLRLFAPTGLGVLLQGETGVGKELAARALHRMSGRRGRFVAVNVAAIPAELLEAELFGSVRGAYTGADRSRGGLVDAADGGTLFLDEIGDMDLPLQVKLLRFLESQEIRPVGSDSFHSVDVRIVSATHHDLERRVSQGEFRHDLYYRVAAAPVTVPALRERREDIPVLKSLFEVEAVRNSRLRPCRWSSEAERILATYDWPGNVRELRHMIEVAMVRAAGAVVLPCHLPVQVPEQQPSASWDEAMVDFRRRFLTAALRRNAGNRSATARELGISRQTLLYHIRNLGLAYHG